MHGRRARIAALVLVLAAARCQPKPTDDDADDDWPDTLRLLLDLFNIGVLAYEHCSPSAGPTECANWFALLGLAFLTVAFGVAVCQCMGVRWNEEPAYKKRRQTLLDGLRAAALAANLQKVGGWTKD